MAKQHRKRRKKAKRRPVQVRPLAPRGFWQALLRAQEAVSSPHPLLHAPVSPHVLLQDWEHEEAITLDDTPFMRVMLTLRACYPQEQEFVSAAARWYALQRLLEEHALAAWVKPVGEDAWQVDTAVFFVAATAPLDAKGQFLLEPFCEALARWVEEHPETNQDGQPSGEGVEEKAGLSGTRQDGRETAMKELEALPGTTEQT